MFSPFFLQAVLSPPRQRNLRLLIVAQLTVVTYGTWGVLTADPGLARVRAEALLGALLVTAGIVEGALVLGWRLTQLPKSQALEFLLVSPLRAEHVVLAETLVGLSRLALVTVAGLPVLALLIGAGRLGPFDLLPLFLLPLTWGGLAGLALTLWAYESPAVRRWGGRLMILGLLLYLLVGVLAGENLVRWLEMLPEGIGPVVLHGLRAFHEYNPFGLASLWFTRDTTDVWPAALAVEAVTVLFAALLLWRCARRLKGHFHERHYRPILEVTDLRRPPVGERPLSWWAVKRVSEYSGRINLWLAGGFCGLYATYTAAGAHWPPWCGRRVFEIADSVGGVPVLAAALVVLAAVPAAFQYGLWDGSAAERCRRLELLLLTRLEARDYWRAAAAAAWQRGRGYFALALLLWAASVVAGRLPLAGALASLAAAVIVWGLYFALGFRDFSRGRNAHALGLVLTLGLPILAYALTSLGRPDLVAWIPPGGVQAAARSAGSWNWAAGVSGAGLLALAIGRAALTGCDNNLRRWYDVHCGGDR